MRHGTTHAIGHHPLVKFALLFLMLTLALVAHGRVYGDSELFERGFRAYEQDRYVEAASFLFAYQQRDPVRIRRDGTHAGQVQAAIDYAMAYQPGAGTKGDDLCAQDGSRPKEGRKPALERPERDHQMREATARERARAQARHQAPRRLADQARGGVLGADGSDKGLPQLLQESRWQRAHEATWNRLVAEGDRDGDGRLSYTENDDFPCDELGELSELWREHYGSSSGFNDILLPRFHNRFVSCGIWRGNARQRRVVGQGVEACECR